MAPVAAPAAQPGTATPERKQPVLASLALADGQRVLAELGTARAGLSSAEARARLARQGPNLLPRARGLGLVRQLLDQLFYFFAVML
jgi:hypothetical protein